MQGAALKLAYMEYADLHLEERLALLQALLEQALDCEVVRELITSKVEAMALPRQKKPVCCPTCRLLLYTPCCIFRTQRVQSHSFILTAGRHALTSTLCLYTAMLCCVMLCYAMLYYIAQHQIVPGPFSVA